MNAPLFEDPKPNYIGAVFPPPREFQVAAHESLRQAVREKVRVVMLMSPTGSGKTYLGMRVAHEALIKGKRVLFICDRRTLINQTSSVADNYGLGAHGVIMADHWRVNPDMPLQIASAQTLMRRDWKDDFDVILVDEAHTQIKWVIEMIKATRAIVIGLSATPFSPGLGQTYERLVNATTMAALTESGVLVPMRILSCSRVNMVGAATSGGEWTEAAAGERGMDIIGDVVKEWQQHAEGRKTIVFGSTIKHCEEMCRQFNEQGVLAQLFTSETKEDERTAILAEFKKPDSSTRVLISVEALAKGFDVPDVGCVVDVRPLRKSLSTAIQMWGRGLRSSPSTGKTDCILMDHSGNIERFADDYSDIFFNGLDSLDMGEKLDAAIRKDSEDDQPKKSCPSCGFSPMGKRCLACGHERQSMAALVEHEAGEMREIHIGKTKLADDRRHLYAQVCTYTRSHGNPETSKGRAWHLFKDLVGSYPEGLSFHRTANVEITRPVLNLIKSRNIRLAKANNRPSA
jgi:superfamily II DNA or RNA helicase